MSPEKASSDALDIGSNDADASCDSAILHVQTSKQFVSIKRVLLAGIL